MILAVPPLSLACGRVVGQTLHRGKGCAPPPRATQASQEFTLGSAALKNPELFHCFCWKQSLESCFNTMSNLNPQRFYFYNLSPGLQTALLASLTTEKG